MTLHLVLGLSSRKADADVSVVYAGRSGGAARAATLASAAPHFVLIDHPLGIVKNNPRAAANAAAQVARQLELVNRDKIAAAGALGVPPRIPSSNTAAPAAR